MGVFKTKGIIVKVDKNGPKENLYTIFSYDYGKIRCNKGLSKKEKALDIGYLINCEIRVNNKKDIQRISNIKILGEFTSTNKDYAIINSFLELLSIVYKNLPDGSPFYEIFNILEKIITENCNLLEKIILSKLKVINLFGNLSEQHDNKTVEKILKFICSSRIDKIFLLSGIDETTLNELKKIV